MAMDAIMPRGYRDDVQGRTNVTSRHDRLFASDMRFDNPQITRHCKPEITTQKKPRTQLSTGFGV